jgi:aminoglycoside/choline kinase family phosphotransferase
MQHMNKRMLFGSWVKESCLNILGEPVQTMEPLEADGSNRSFFRVRARKRTLIVLYHPDGRPGVTGENDSHVAIGRHLKARGIPTPTIYAYDRDRGLIIQEDLGDFNLQRAISTAESDREILCMYEGVLDLLLNLQLRGRVAFKEEWCYQGARYDEQLMVKKESGYFLKVFLRAYLGWGGDDKHIQREFVKLARLASEAPVHFLMHRDFQSRNLLLPPSGEPHVIDFQGARWGPLQYDLAALIVDPYVPLTPLIRKKILRAYLKRLDASGIMDGEQFNAYYPLILLHRNLQILGAFAFLGHVQGKPFFLQWIPSALKTLHKLLEEHVEWDCSLLRESVAEAMEKLC